MNKIEETKKYLIEKNGEPFEKIIDGRKYRYINTTLNNFNELVECFKNVADIYTIDLKEEHINSICDFAVTEVEPNVVNVIKKFRSYIKAKNNRINFGKNSFAKLIDALEEFYNSEKYDPRFLMNIFVKHTKCANIHHKNNFTHMY